MTSQPTVSSARGRAVPAVLLAVVVVAGTVLAAALDLQVTAAERERAHMEPGVLITLVGTFVTLAAAVLLWLRPRHRVGVLLAALGLLWHVDGIAESWGAYSSARDLPGTDLAYWVFVRFGALLLAFFIVVLVLYPDGRLGPGRARVLGLGSVLCAPALPVVLLLVPDRVLFEGTGIAGVDTELLALSMSDGTAYALMRGGQALTMLGFVLALAALVVRYRLADEEVRLSLRWLLWGGIMCLLSIGLLTVLGPGTLASVVFDATVVVVAASIAVGVAAPRFVDIDSLVVSTVTSGLVVAALVGLDLALLALARELLSGTAASDARLVVIVVVVLLYAPLRSLVGQGVRRVAFGRRDDRYAVVSSFARRMEGAADVHEQLPALAAAVADAFRVPWVRVEVVMPGGELLSADHGSPAEPSRSVEMSYRDQRIGRLVLPARGGRALLSRRDHGLLLDLARQAALAVRTGLLAEELQAGRERLVLAREDDRRRIRRDLHDGLGPVLGGVALRLQAASNAAEHDPGLARELIGQSRGDVQEALEDVRRLVHGMRPPALDDLGLAAAIEQQGLRLRDELDVSVITHGLDGLPAAVEVAAYRIVSESLTNVVRHADARHCHVALRIEGDPPVLQVRVADDGRGIPERTSAGVGLLSVRERAEELGGHSEVTCPPGGGTEVLACLPLGTPYARRVTEVT